MPDDIVAELRSLTAAEPAITEPLAPPRYLDRYAELVAKARAVASPRFGLIYELPHSLRYESDAQLISGDSEDGLRLAHSLSDAARIDTKER